MSKMRVLVTGASGFIGSAFVRKYWRTYDIRALIRSDSSLARMRLGNFYNPLPQIERVSGDLLDPMVCSGLCEGMDAVLHFAARTHVDHSIRSPEPFLLANVMATANLLEDARKHKVGRFVQVSTDEVLGQCLGDPYTEDAPIRPRNPYAASKAGAEALAISYAHTYGLHTVITRTENNHGKMQNSQKALPVFVRKIMNNEKIPVYGDGKHVRQWLHVDDHIDAQHTILQTKDDLPGETYHIAGNQELMNIELARIVIETALGRDVEDLTPHVQYIPDHDIRPGHDRRYALNCAKMKAVFGWTPKWPLKEGLANTIDWYMRNPNWETR